MNVTVLGAGAWGTAIAASAAGQPGRHTVRLWSRDPAQSAGIAVARENTRYLPGITLPPALQSVSGALDDAVRGADLVILATPMAALRGMLLALRGLSVPLAWLAKGFEASVDGAPGLLPHEVCAAVAPALRAGSFSGPSFAQEVARGQPAALAAASRHAVVRDALVEAFHNTSLRVYGNDDLVGVEVGGAVKNVLAIATGLCDGLHLGLNARAALITRGLAEMTRLGQALGARPDTFMGLSGMGDLILTATGDLSRNRRVGLLLAQGQSLRQAVDSLGHVAEGVYCARTVVQRARSLGVEMPISEQVVAVLDGALQPADAVAALMGRGAGREL